MLGLFMKRLTAKDQASILHDWFTLLPSFTKYNSHHLIKRHGPIVLCLYLKPVYGGEHYVPVFHIHSLLNQFETLTITAGREFVNHRGVEESISLSRHNASFPQLAEQYKIQCPLLFTQSIECHKIDTYYSEAIHRFSTESYQELLDSCLLLKYFNQDELLLQRITTYDLLINSWPSASQFTMKNNFKWQTFCLNLFNNMDFEKQMKTQSIRLSIDSFKDYGLFL